MCDHRAARSLLSLLRFLRLPLCFYPFQVLFLDGIVPGLLLPADLPCLLYPRTFSTDLDNVICERQGSEKGKWDANGGRRSSFPCVQQIGITGLLTKHNDLKYLRARLCLLSPSMAAIAF